jgi:hypothetical protein
MICAACGRPAPTDEPCPACGLSPLLGGRWRLESEIGRGAAGTVFRATEVGTGRAVAAKEVPLPRHAARGAAAACAREAEVLRQLDHPGIPRLVDAEVIGSTLWVFQELVDGESLQCALQRHRYSEDEVLALIEELLGILAYLHGLSPPVIHRDIKPANLIVRRDGRLALVDFGSVRDRIAEGPLTTAAGTFGYMAPEQLRGEAGPGSDLYAVGAVAVALLSRRDPASLLGWDQRIAWRGHVQVRRATGGLLDRLLTPDPARRPSSAARLLGAVRAARTGREPTRRWRTAGIPVGIAAMVGLALLGGEGVREAWFPEPAIIDDPQPAPRPPSRLAQTSRVPVPTAATTPTPVPEAPPTPASGSSPTPVSGALPDSLEADAATGAVHPVLAERAAVECAYAMLGGLLTSELSYDAAFDEYVDDFTQLGWRPDRECRWYATGSVELEGESSVLLHAVITRGSGVGRQLTLRPGGDVHEARRLSAAEVKTVVASGSQWPGSVAD